MKGNRKKKKVITGGRDKAMNTLQRLVLNLGSKLDRVFQLLVNEFLCNEVYHIL